MLDPLWLIVDFFLGFWKRLPESLKKEIIEFISTTFQDFFREYYKNYKSHQDTKNEQS